MAGVPPPPRQLDVRRFAAARAGELRSLHESVSARLAGRLTQPRSARRRTTGHLPSNKRRRRRSRDAEAADGTEEEEGRPSRRVRRRRELAGNPAEGFSAAGDGARRLRTHLWHAKRFSMERRWGFVLPIGAHGRGRGSRTVLKWLKNGTVVHDASYFTPVELDGPEDSLLSIVRMVLHPSPQDKTPGLKHLHGQVMRGVCYENAMLCRVGCPHLEIVGPVTYMWRPFLREGGELETEDVDLSNSQIISDERNSLRRQLWIWIHPSALSEGLETLRAACHQQMQESGDTISCCSLEGKMARLEVMGSNAMQSLKSILKPVSNPSISTKLVNKNNVTTSTDPLYCSTGSHLLKRSVFDNADILQSGAILSMIVHDPRDNSVEGTDSSKTVSLDQNNQLMEEYQVPNADETPSGIGNILSSIWLNPGNHDLALSDCRELWDSSLKINPPVDEKILCMEKHHRRMKFFCLDSGNDQGQTSQEKDSIGRSCPVILLKHAKGSLISVGWSVILPLSWVKPFWFYLVSHGAHAIGLRERRWIASKLKMPCFPYDYPDSKAYSLFMAEEAAVLDKATNCRPSSMRPPRVPVPPLWHCVIASFRKGDGILSNLEDDLKSVATVLSESIPVNSNSGDAESSPTSAPTSFQLLVPRTIQVLRQYVKKIDEKYLNSSDMEAVTGKSSLVSGDNVKTGCSINRLCLVRVLIRAFKEGSFEEGAVVCAPLPSDLSAWNRKTSFVSHCILLYEMSAGKYQFKKLIPVHASNRSEEEEEECLEKWELQLPQSHVSSYFSWLDPSTSNLQLPNGDSTRKAFRWPIGFITTGFVHGSSGQDAVAVAFCEAKLLAVLRRQQWRTHESLKRKDICVLIRNARSAAYRRALATIVLEQQEDDLKSEKQQGGKLPTPQ
uniref:Ribonucleases P/MRP protein subunit POP1 containing protein-like n=1 Tax=Oryza nivara TaxID=4536 RepID=A0A679BDD7_ORYNI|nr:ribonucleases P/MRP protein subunit POP1 containing protein-like [Oryza sativa f. spontanea]